MNKKVLVGLAAVIIIGILAAAGIIIYDKIAEKYRESEVKADLSAYYNVPEGEAMLIFDEKVYEKNGLYLNGEVYLDLPTVSEKYTTLFMWSPEENRLYYTSATKAYIFTPDEKGMLVNEKQVENEIPMVVMKDGVPYVSMSFLSTCSNITYRVYTEPARVLLTYSTDEYLCASLKEETSIRVGQDIKSDYLEKLTKGSKVRVIEGGGIQQNGFIKVMSEDGVRGYILEEKLDWENRFNETPSFNAFEAEKYKHITSNEKIFLSWQLVYSKGHISEMLDNLNKNPEINVVSPTWFFMSGSNGEITSYGDPEYVAAAHERNVKVWAVLKNDVIDGVFDGAGDSHKVFSSYNSRKNLINNLVSAMEECGADGVNIDIENLNVDTGIYFVQFLRELYFKCSEKGIVVSVDNYIPENYNAFYNIPEQSKVVDYIVIMGYDEHYMGSDAGSVSSLSWFTYAADLTLKKCPAEQIIMGVPFYTRLWKEVSDGDAVRTYSESMDLKAQDKFLAELKIEPEWLDDAGQYYYEYEKEGAKYKLWAEEKKSLTLKAMVIDEKKLAGAAAWMMGGETDGIWSAIKSAANGDFSALSEGSSNTQEAGEISD